MKRKYLIGLIVIVICFILTGCEKKEETKKISLDTLAKIINTSKTAKSYKDFGYKIKATNKSNKFEIKIKTSESTSNVTFDVKGSVLSNEKLTNEELMQVLLLIDSVGQMHGYKEGELTETINALPDEAKKYTLEKEGLEIKIGEETNSIKIDYTKKIPLIDMTDFYLKPDQFGMIKQIVDENSNGNQTGLVAKLAYDIVIGIDENYIYVGEKEKLTNSAYKTILSALEVMYGPSTANKFETLYPSFKNKKITINEFTIEPNYKVENQNESIFKDKKVVLVTIKNK